MPKNLFLLSPIFLCIFSCFSTTATLAQISSDNTLNTQVNSNGSVSEITGGQTRGNNLFHSFQDFSVFTGKEAFFNNAGNIANIFSRITGSNISNIDGLIRNNGDANLFLINPNGIIFGEEASLDIGGSFLGSTADSILFDGGEFSATDLDSSPLLTINAPIGLSFSDNPEEIVNRSTVTDSMGNSVGLEVLAGKNLNLIGGRIQFEGGRITAKEGKIELGALLAAGSVGISEDGSLTFPNDLAKADIILRDGAAVNVRSSSSGGNIIVNAANLFTQGSFLSAGISNSLINNDAQAGNIEINLTDNLNLNSSRITNIVGVEGVGDAGNINITTGSIELTNAGFISAGTVGQGNGGNIDIITRENVTLDGESSSITSRVEPDGVGNAGDVTLSTKNLNLVNGGFIDAVTRGQGNAGNLTIASDNITITGKGQINTSTFGRGNAGLIDLTANDSLLLNGSNSFISSQVAAEAEGNAGDINISTGDIILINGAFIDAITRGRGNGGDVNITASDTLLINTGSIDGNRFNSSNNRNGILTQVEQGGQGNAGNVNIIADSLSLQNGARIGSDTFSQGDAGSIDITANKIALEGVNLQSEPTNIGSRVESNAVGNAGDVTIITNNLNLTNGGQINAGVAGQGNGGDINITVNEDLDIESRVFNTGIFSEVNPAATGNAGNIDIFTGNLNIRDGGLIDTSTSGVGDAGSINIVANNNISIDGENLNLQGFTSRISSRVNSGAAGNAKNVAITTDNLILTNGGYLDASTFGLGSAGLLDITAKDITFKGRNSQVPSSAFSQVNPSGEGDAGGVTINADNLTLVDGGNISTSTFGQGNAGNVEILVNNLFLDGFGTRISSAVETGAVGNAGNINIEANSLSLNNQASINAITQSTISNDSNNNGAANITLQIAQDIRLQNSSLISAQALNNANGGNVTINNEDGFILAFPNQNSDIIANAEQGRGGKIEINTQAIFGIEERPLNDLTNDINASSEFGLSGTVEINILETNPNQNDLDISVETVNTEVTRTCNSTISGDRSEFVVTGRGGMPTEPEDNFRLPAIATAEKVTRANTPTQPSEDSAQIIEASAWVRNAEGKILLVAAPAISSFLDSPSDLASCN